MEETKIKLIQPDGQVVEAEVLAFFKLEDNGKDYILYTFNELDEQNMIKINASSVTKDETSMTLETIDDEEEWKKVKDVMRQIIRDNKE